MLLIAVCLILLAMILALVRSIKGPTVYDRILASNSFGVKTITLIVTLGFLFKRPDLYIDIALMYALIGFIGSVAVLKVSEFGNLGQPQSSQNNKNK
tara:strand:+ start:248 stop:538 length:291 start_codon:yes stop_codon:yes gene_type:complete